MSLGTCRHCQYQPVASDAKRCPRCGGFNPHPSAAGSIIRAVLLDIAALFALAVCGGALLLARIFG